MAINEVKIEIAPGREITIETGKMALLANGSVTVQCGETIIMVAACSGPARDDADFFPLQVDYREKFSAAGRFPGGFFKREGRPSEKEILTARMTDRPLRPLFPKGFYDEVQIQSLLLSADGENDSDVLSMLGASVALCVSDIPFGGPCGAVRVGRIGGEFVANPTHSEMKKSDLDLVYSGIEDKTIMIEGGADEISEEVLRDALSFANEIVKKQIAAQKELMALCGKAKYEPTLHLIPEDILSAVAEASAGKLDEACLKAGKQERQDAMDAVLAGFKEELVAKLTTEERDEEDTEKLIKKAFSKTFENTMRSLILNQHKRIDGRGLEDLRPLTSEVDILPRPHGSALFARGETQALVVTTLGSDGDGQDSDGITGGETTKTFMLHYNFPNYSVGETGRIMGPGRREIGHGNLAERCLARVMPDDYPYAVRCVSEVMGSNGSTSMASICGGSLSLLHAGVPLKGAVAGISCGLVTADGNDYGDNYVMLTDILGAEDHYGDMDFKVAGTEDGITGFQLDLKTPGITIDMMYEAMLRNKTARLDILDNMNACISEPGPGSPFAPKIHVMTINPEKIGALIGPGGSVIKGLCEEHSVQINIEDDGTVKIFAVGNESLKGAINSVEGIVGEVEVGKIYKGEVKAIKDFGAFVEVLPGQDGLLHISEIANYRVRNVEDVMKVGEEVTVKCLDVDDRGRIRLSRKAALEELGLEDETAPQS